MLIDLLEIIICIPTLLFIARDPAVMGGMVGSRRLMLLYSIDIPWLCLG